jgi:hypothetical protein
VKIGADGEGLSAGERTQPVVEQEALLDGADYGWVGALEVQGKHPQDGNTVFMQRRRSSVVGENI